MNEERKQFHDSIRATCSRYLEIFPDETERLSSLMGYLDDPSLDLRLRSTIPEGHLCASGILILPDNKLLMLEHKALGIWVVPGGHYDLTDGELANAAIRETAEETGLTVPIKLHPWHLQHGVPIDIDTHPIPRSEKKNEDAHQHFDFRYVLTVDDPAQVIAQLALDSNEVTGFAEIPISEVDPASSIAPALRKLGLLASSL
jgi:8-oxo-dGTP pyrophosphatase MutT (NUDIX family)